MQIPPEETWALYTEPPLSVCTHHTHTHTPTRKAQSKAGLGRFQVQHPHTGVSFKPVKRGRLHFTGRSLSNPQCLIPKQKWHTRHHTHLVSCGPWSGHSFYIIYQTTTAMQAYTCLFIEWSIFKWPHSNFWMAHCTTMTILYVWRVGHF